jgi:hypothetical protein
MWLFSGAPEEPEAETLIEQHSAKGLCAAVKRLKHAIWSEDQGTEQDAAHRMMQIAKHWNIRRLSDSKLTNRKPLVQIPNENVHLVDLE